MKGTRTSGRRAVRRSASSRPLIPGITTSVSNRWMSPEWLLASAKAAGPKAVSRTRYPCRVRVCRTALRTATGEGGGVKVEGLVAGGRKVALSGVVMAVNYAAFRDEFLRSLAAAATA